MVMNLYTFFLQLELLSSIAHFSIPVQPSSRRHHSMPGNASCFLSAEAGQNEGYMPRRYSKKASDTSICYYSAGRDGFHHEKNILFHFHQRAHFLLACQKP